jgi:hypothetical protein
MLPLQDMSPLAPTLPDPPESPDSFVDDVNNVLTTDHIIGVAIDFGGLDTKIAGAGIANLALRHTADVRGPIGRAVVLNDLDDLKAVRNLR